MSQRRWSSPIWLGFVLLTACASPTEPWPRPPEGVVTTVGIDHRMHLREGVLQTVDGQAKRPGAADAQAQRQTRR